MLSIFKIFNVRKIVLVFALFTSAAVTRGQKFIPSRVIFDTDMGPDYDDVGAIALLHAFADSGKTTILGTIASTQYEGVASVLNIFNTYFGRPDLPVGIAKRNGLNLRDGQHWSDTLIANYQHKLMRNGDAWDAVELYRKLLASEDDKTVTIITTGFFTNLDVLLKSAGDEYSPLNGIDLVRTKVKQLVCMAGAFPEGYEFNVDKDVTSSRFVFSTWPTTILFSGFEIGEKIKTGLDLVNNSRIVHSPVKDVFRISMVLSADDHAGRMSWDETAVLVGVLGISPWYNVKSGHIELDASGKNTWNVNGSSQSYLIENEPYADVERYINKLMMHQPVK